MAADDEKPSEHGKTTGSRAGKHTPLFAADWLKAASEGPVRFYSGVYHNALGATARQFQAQADYLRKLSEIDQPADALACHSEFARATLAGLIDEGKRVFDQSLEIAAGRK